MILILANNHCMQEIILKIRRFQRGLSKSLKKVRQDYENGQD